MGYRRKSPYECSVEELDRELIARGSKTSVEKRFGFNGRPGTPQRDVIMARVKAFYHNAASLSPDIGLRHISTWKLAETLVYMTEGVPLDDTRAISGNDDRLDIFRLKDKPDNIPIKKNAGSVAAICLKNDLVQQDDGYSSLEHVRFGETFNLCRCEPFFQQPVGAGHLFSGFLVRDDMIATAGHCVDEKNVTDIRILFGFRMKDASTSVTRVPNTDVYKGVRIIRRYYNRRGNGADWALVKLDRKVTGRRAVKLPGTVIFRRQPVYVLGHPCGLPLKYAAGAEVRKVNDAFFVADLDIYAGSSGSPIFNKNTHEVIGMVVRGYSSDFRWTGNCYISVTHPTPGAKDRETEYSRLTESRSAECTRVSEFIHHCG